MDIQWIKPLDKKLRGTLQWKVQAINVPPNGTQYEKQSTSYEGFLPKRLNLNLEKSLQLTQFIGEIITN